VVPAGRGCPEETLCCVLEWLVNERGGEVAGECVGDVLGDLDGDVVLTWLLLCSTCTVSARQLPEGTGQATKVKFNKSVTREVKNRM